MLCYVFVLFVVGTYEPQNAKDVEIVGQVLNAGTTHTLRYPTEKPGTKLRCDTIFRVLYTFH